MLSLLSKSLKEKSEVLVSGVLQVRTVDKHRVTECRVCFYAYVRCWKQHVFMLSVHVFQKFVTKIFD